MIVAFRSISFHYINPRVNNISYMSLCTVFSVAWFPVKTDRFNLLQNMCWWIALCNVASSCFVFERYWYEFEAHFQAEVSVVLLDS
jgi:hypothetical protein